MSDDEPWTCEAEDEREPVAEDLVPGVPGRDGWLDGAGMF